MYHLVWDEPFKQVYRDWIAAHPQYSEVVKEKIRLIANDPFHPSLKTHQLSGNLAGLYGSRITLELRIIFCISQNSEITIYLIGFGDHTEVF